MTVRNDGLIGTLNAFPSSAFFNAAIISRLRFLVALSFTQGDALHPECLSERMAYRGHPDLHNACRSDTGSLGAGYLKGPRISDVKVLQRRADFESEVTRSGASEQAGGPFFLKPTQNGPSSTAGARAATSSHTLGV